MKIKAKIQRGLAVGWEAKDDGEFVFFLCRRGLEAATGKRYKPKDIVDLEVEINVLSINGAALIN